MTLAGDERSSAPDGASDDSLAEGKHHRSVVAATPNGERLQRLLEAIEGFGDDADEYFEEALEDAKKHRDGVLFEVARAMGDCHDDDYPLRWSLTYAAATIGGKKALPLLVNVAQTPIPEEKSPDPHSFSSVEEETIIRTTAVDGIADLARDGNEAAEEALFDLVRSPSFSIRRAAVTGLRSSPRGDDLVDRIADCLPDEERFMLELKRTDVRKVEQIEDPRLHLSESGAEERKEVPPEFPSSQRRPHDPGPEKQTTIRGAEAEENSDREEEGD